MGAIKEFIKEHSPAPETPKKKKKKRVRLKNFNPFRKRKYDLLNETNPDLDQCCSQETKFPVADSHDSPRTKNKSHKRPRPKELLQAAWGSLGFAKGNPDDPDSAKRKKARKRGAYECLIEEESFNETADDAGETIKTLTDSPTASDDEEGSGEKAGSPELKRVAISDDIEVIETCEQEPPQKKKKKSAKKRIKKAGIKTAKYLGEGLANMALTFQYMTPDAAMVPATKEVARIREERYRELYSQAASIVS